MAVKCDSYKSFTSGKCEGNEVIPMGMATPRKAWVFFFYLILFYKTNLGFEITRLKLNFGQLE